MVFDIDRTLHLIKGALFDPEATWQEYLPEAGNWQKTAALLTGPLIVTSAVLAYLVGFLGSDAALFGMFRPTIGSTIANIILGAVGAATVAFVFSALSGAFGGKNSFALGLAGTTLAFVPGYAGQALAQLPWIGGLIGLGLFVYALVLLWRIVPVYLEVPEAKRTGHYILSLVGTIAAMVVISFLVRPLVGQTSPAMLDFQASDASSIGSGGLLGGAMRQAELMAAAEEDRYDPPADGKLEEDQVEEFIRIMNRAAEIIEAQSARMRELSERADRNEDISMSEMSEMMSGATQMMGLASAEIELVKSADGNWAEHQWVKESLRTAYLQRDISDAVKHNHELFLKFEDQLKSYVTR